MRFTRSREVVLAGFSPDPNPNTTEPNAAAVSAGTAIDKWQSGPTSKVYVRLVDDAGAEVPAATATFAVWVQDEGASEGGVSRWARAKTTAALPSSELLSVDVAGPLFVQLLEVSVATATRAQVWFGALNR